MDVDPAAESARLDRWLWSVRLCATRPDAAAACSGGHVTVNGRPAKPATVVRIGDVVEARLHGRDRVVVVRRPIVKRVGAAVAVECFEDRSPPPPEAEELAVVSRDRGAGRPTKRDRRRTDRLRGRG